MTPKEYLNAVLKDQTFASDDPELEELRQHREDVEALLRQKLESSPHIRYGGSRAKGTMNRDSYDLDIICYFDHDSDEDGATLSDLYNTVYGILQEEYWVEQKTCSIRLKSKDPATLAADFHIDVVPGRYVDDTRSDCFLHQTRGDKSRFKTNLQVHIDHIKDSGVVPAIRLLKLWRAKRSLQIKQFVLELLAVDLLSSEKGKDLNEQIEHFWQEVKDSDDPITVEDPANPEGNDLTPLLTQDIWLEFRGAAETTLWQIENNGWEIVFGAVEEEEESQEEKTARAREAVATVHTPTRPWREDEE